MRKRDLIAKIALLERNQVMDYDTIKLLGNELGLDLRYPYDCNRGSQFFKAGERALSTRTYKLESQLESVPSRLGAAEIWIKDEVIPYADIEYTYEITPTEQSAEGEEIWAGWWWSVTMNPSPRGTIAAIRPFKEFLREVGSGAADTHDEAWAAIKEAILDHKQKLIEDRAFNNMRETKGTVKW